MYWNQKRALWIFLALCVGLCAGLSGCEASEENTLADTSTDAPSDTNTDDTSDTSDTNATDTPLICDAIAIFCYPCDGTNIGQEPTYVGCDATCPAGYAPSCEYEQYPLCDASVEFVCCGADGARTPRCPLGNNPECLPGETAHPSALTCEAQNAPDCPAGPQSPLGLACDSAAYQHTQCAYGYDPPECGGRTVTCEDDVWVEVVHTDPQPSCHP